MTTLLNLPRLRFTAILATRFVAFSAACAAAEPVAASFLEKHCVSCHEGAAAEAGLDLSNLGDDLANPAVEKHWVRIFDRVHDGEMPPKDADQPSPAEVETFLDATGDRLRSFQLTRDAQLGRVRARRLTRREVERSLHALLGIDIPLAGELPEEMRSSGFTTVADGQSMSHFQLERHLAAVDLALDEAFRRCLSPPDEFELDLDPAEIVRRNPRVRCREPELREGLAATWSSGLIFYGASPRPRLPTTVGTGSPSPSRP